MRSRWDEGEMIRHLTEHPGDPDDMDYALDIGARNPKEMVDHIRFMDNLDVEELNPEQVAEFRQNLDHASRYLGGSHDLDMSMMRDQWRHSNHELRSHNFSYKTQQDTWRIIDSGRDLKYGDLVKLSGMDEAIKHDLFEEMSPSSQLRYAITFPSESVVQGELLTKVLDHFNGSLPSGMANMADHPYTWSLLDNPLKNPNLTAEQLDEIADAFSEIGCNPKNMEARYNAGRVLNFIVRHPNCGAETKAYAEEYQAWLKSKNPSV